MRNLIVLILFLVSCESVRTVDCAYHVKTRSQVADKSPLLPQKNVVGYLYYADTINYTVISYDQAFSGKISKIATGETKNFDIEAVQNEVGVVFNNVTQKEVFMVVCDTENKIYSFRQAEVGAGISQIYISLNFLPWRLTGNDHIYINGWKQAK